VAVLSLALGIGANSAIFSFADALMLRPLPVARPGEVVSIVDSGPGGFLGGSSNFSYPDYCDFRDKNKSFDSVVAFDIIRAGMRDRAQDVPQLRTMMAVSGNLFQAMEVAPVLGRAFRPDEDQVVGRDAVMVLGHDFWQSQLNSDPGVIGRKVQLSGVEFTII